jgi:hypothetical protein
MLMLAAVTVPFLVLNAQLTTFALSVVIPALVALVTKWSAAAWVKVTANAVLSAVAAAITMSVTIDGTAVLSRSTLLLAGEQFALSMLAYLGLYKPSNLGAKIAPNVGLG